jgi:16S rRNA (cytosine967-C5)-methyltransferase
MSGNYRPRRRHGAPGNAKGSRGTGGAGKPDEGRASTRAAAEGAASRTGPGTPGGKPGTSRARSAAVEPAAAKRDSDRRARSARRADPRRTAYDVLAAVHDREAYANLLLPRLLGERGLAGRDAALATELAYGTLRGLGTYDAVLAACSDRPLDKLDPPVLDVLRLGAHQLLNTRVGAHAAVATSVDLAKSVAGPRVSGYVNAVLRRVATRDLAAWLDLVAPDPAADRDGYLAVRYSHPRWIVAAYRDALGDAADDPAPATVGSAVPPEPETSVTELAAALAAGNARPRVTLATFPSGPPREDVMPAGAEPGRWSPYAFTLQSGDPTPLTESGAAAVQDEGSQLAAIALSRALVTPRVGEEKGQAERWLDMCAGPGGKSRMLYGLAADSGASLVAAELHPHRAALVADALTRVGRPGMPPPEVIVADGTHPAWPDGAFDRVLVDVPCSGLGALRRRPEARWRKSEANLKELTALQRDLLRSALAAVRPGGVIGYVTCSPVPAETRDVVTDVAASMPGVAILDAPAVLANVPGACSANPLFAQLWPHRHGTDAIFIALLRRDA